jgi:hypothetical protein
MGREARANKSAEKSATFHHQTPVKKEVKVWTTEEMRAAILTGKLPKTATETIKIS